MLNIDIQKNGSYEVLNDSFRLASEKVKIQLRDKPFFENEAKRIGVYLSEDYYTVEEARTILTHQYLTGGNVCVSERLPELQDSRQKMLRHVIPVYGGPARIIDFDRPVCPNTFLTEITPVCESLGNWWTLALANWEEENALCKVCLKDILPDTDAKKNTVFEFHTQRFMGLKAPDDEIELNIPVHGVRLLRIVPFEGTKPVLLERISILPEAAAK